MKTKSVIGIRAFQSPEIIAELRGYITDGWLHSNATE